MKSLAITAPRFHYLLIIAVAYIIGTAVLIKSGILVVGGYILIGYAVMCYLQPFMALCLYLMVYPLFSTISFSLGSGIPDLYFSRVVVIVLLAMVVARWYFGKMEFRKFTPTEFGMILFTVLVFVSMKLNREPDFIGKVLVFLDFFIIPFTLFVLAKNLIKTPKDFITLTKVLIVPILYLSIIALYEHFSLQDVMAAHYPPGTPEYLIGLRNIEGITRANGPFTHAESFGVVSGMLLVLISLHLGKLETLDSKHFIPRWMAIGLVGMIFTGLYVNMFRSITIGAIGGLMLRYFALRKYRVKVILAIALIALIGYGTREAIEHSTVYKKRVTNTDNFNLRLATYKSALTMFVENPIVGYGFENYRQVYEKYNFYETYKNLGSLPNSHNTYLSILVENGIIAFSVYFAIIGSFGFYVLKLFRSGSDKTAREMAPVFLGVLFAVVTPSVMFDFKPLFDINNLFFTIMGILVGFTQIIEAKEGKLVEPGESAPTLN